MTSITVVMLVIVFSLGNTMSSSTEKTTKQPGVPLLLAMGSASSAVSSPGFKNLLYSASAYAAAKLPANHYSSQSSAPSLDVNVVKLEECEEEFDETIREAKFAFRSTDLGSWDSSPSEREMKTDSDPKIVQHWALVIHFVRGKKTYLFEAGRDENGLLQPGRAEGVDYEVFANATYFGDFETSPKELLMKAKQVQTGNYHVLFNNCQTWLKDFLRLVSPKLIESLHDKVPATKFSAETEEVPGNKTFPKVDMYLRSIDKYLISIGRIFHGLLL